MGDGRFADHHVHACAHLRQDLFGVVALVVQAHPRRGQHADRGLAGHRSTAEDRQTVPGGHLDHLEHFGVTVGDELRDGFPDPVAVIPSLGNLMGVRAEPEPDVRLRNRVRNLVGGRPEHLHRARRGLRERVPHPVQACHRKGLVEPGDDACRAVTDHGIGEHRDRQLAALDVQVAVDEARDQVPPAHVDDSRVRSRVRPDVPHCCDDVPGHGHVGGIDLTCRNIDQQAAGQHDVGLSNTFRGVDLLSQLHVASLVGVLNNPRAELSSCRCRQHSVQLVRAQFNRVALGTARL